jgi:tellurite resistance protein
MDPDPKRKLKGMLARIFSDAVADEGERGELKAYLASGVLTTLEIQEVIADFVQTTWRITMADGVISEPEKARLREIVNVLGLDPDVLPPEWSTLAAEARSDRPSS